MSTFCTRFQFMANIPPHSPLHLSEMCLWSHSEVCVVDLHLNAYHIQYSVTDIQYMQSGKLKHFEWLHASHTHTVHFYSINSIQMHAHIKHCKFIIRKNQPQKALIGFYILEKLQYQSCCIVRSFYWQSCSHLGYGTGNSRAKYWPLMTFSDTENRISCGNNHMN